MSEGLLRQIDAELMAFITGKASDASKSFFGVQANSSLTPTAEERSKLWQSGDFRREVFRLPVRIEDYLFSETAQRAGRGRKIVELLNSLQLANPDDYEFYRIRILDTFLIVLASAPEVLQLVLVRLIGEIGFDSRWAYSDEIFETLASAFERAPGVRLGRCLVFAFTLLFDSGDPRSPELKNRVGAIYNKLIKSSKVGSQSLEEAMGILRDRRSIRDARRKLSEME